MTLLSRAALASTMLMAGCGGEPPETLATAAFERFQDALLGSDRNALAATLSRVSLEALAELPLERARGKRRLVAVGVRPAPPAYLIEVRDPNENDKRSTFVVTREDGRYVVDLVATAGQHQVADPRAAHARPQWRLEPGTVSKRDVEQAAAAIERSGLRGASAGTRR